jgi:peptidyl-prolyl cis-trans isomerase C
VAEEATAKLLIDRIKGGVTLASLSAEFSLDEATKVQGGLNNWTPQGELLPPIREAVQGLTKGQLVATPVRGPAGWHVVQLEDRRSYQAPVMEQVRPQLAQALAQQRIQQKLDELRKTAKVE